MEAGRAFVAGLVSVALLAGCGGDDGGDGALSQKGGAEGADAFVACFKAPGYKAAKPAPQQESLFALTANKRGFPNTPVNISESGNTIAASVFLAFFESEEKAKQALDELGRTSIGDVPPQQRGPVVIGYSSAEDKSATEKGIAACVK